MSGVVSVQADALAGIAALPAPSEATSDGGASGFEASLSAAQQSHLGVTDAAGATPDHTLGTATGPRDANTPAPSGPSSAAATALAPSGHDASTTTGSSGGDAALVSKDARSRAERSEIADSSESGATAGVPSSAGTPRGESQSHPTPHGHRIARTIPPSGSTVAATINNVAPAADVIAMNAPTNLDQTSGTVPRHSSSTRVGAIASRATDASDVHGRAANVAGSKSTHAHPGELTVPGASRPDATRSGDGAPALSASGTSSKDATAGPLSAAHAEHSASSGPVAVGAAPSSAAATVPSSAASTLALALASASASSVAASAVTGASVPQSASTSLPGVASQLLTVLTPLRTTAGGTQSITIALHPEGLGDVRATMAINDGQLVLRLSASTPEGSAALRAALPELHNGFDSAAQAPRIVLSDGSGGGSQFASPSHDQAPETPMFFAGGDRPSTGRAAEPAPMGPMTDPTASASEALLDVRV